MHLILVTAFLSTLIVFSRCFEASHHRHRHSHSHPQEYNFDRLLNRLDAQANPKSPETTTKPPHNDKFDDFGVTGTDTDPGNSLWNENDSQDTSTLSPLDEKRWDEILKRNNIDKDKHREEVEDSEDDADEQAEDDDDDEGLGDKEQSDSYRPWSPNNGETYSSWKWKNMGSPKAVDNLFQIYRSGNLKPDAAAKESADKIEPIEVFRHSKLMAKEALCKWPRPKVIRVADVYGSTSKLYAPPCTVLHQCGEDTGCCSGTNQLCGPKTTKRVELYFYTTYIMGSQNGRTSQGIEKLPFYNHTECECVNRLEEMMPRDGGLNAEFRNERPSEKGCKCPSEYTVRRLANGSCSCDCFDKQRDCIKYKRGKEYFNHNDRLCIERGTCEPPSCDFGAYLKNFGRCPRKHEKFRTWPRHHH